MHDTKPTHCMLYVTAASKDEALHIGRTLVTEGLVACANVLPGMQSIYRWQGAVEEAEETVLIAKTRKDLAEAAVARVVTPPQPAAKASRARPPKKTVR